VDGPFLVGIILRARRWQVLDDGVHQLVDAAAVLGADREDVEARAVQLSQIERVLPLVGVDLIGGQEHGLSAAAEQLRELVLCAGEALDGVDHEDDHVGLGDGRFSLLPHGLHQQLFRLDCEATGVDDAEPPGALLRLCVLPIARHAGAVLDDGELAPDDLVEQGRLAHVGAAHERDEGQH